MIEKIFISLIFLMCCLLLVPILFAGGGAFDSTREHILCDGSVYIEHGVYVTDVFNTVLLVMTSFLGVVIPFLKTNLKWYWRWISALCGSWFIVGLIYQLLNYSIPVLAFESIDQNWANIKISIMFTLSIAAIITHETWIKQKKLDR